MNDTYNNLIDVFELPVYVILGAIISGQPQGIAPTNTIMSESLIQQMKGLCIFENEIQHFNPLTLQPIKTHLSELRFMGL